MQNKYKLPQDVRLTLINIVKGYDRRAAEIKQREAEICSISGGRYETYTVEDGEERRAFTPSGKGGTSSPVENQFNELDYYHKHDENYKRNQAIDKALEKVQITSTEAQKIKDNIIESCKNGRFYNFDYAGISSINRSRFYQLRNKFLLFLAKELNFF